MTLPNQLTVARIVLTPIFLFFFLMEDPLYKQISVGIFIIAALTDWYDGWLARKFNYITEWGKFMDPLADKILTSTTFFAFCYLGVLEYWMVAIIVFRDLLITALRFYADYNKHAFATSRLAKWKTFFQMAFLYYLLLMYAVSTIEPFYSNNLEFFETLSNPTAYYFIMLFITIFTLYTGFRYLARNKSLLKKIFTFNK